MLIYKLMKTEEFIQNIVPCNYCQKGEFRDNSLMQYTLIITKGHSRLTSDVNTAMDKQSFTTHIRMNVSLSSGSIL